MAPQKHKEVWNFFKRIDSLNVNCNLCGKPYKTSGNTTNVISHLKSKHNHAFSQLLKVNRNNRSEILQTSKAASKTVTTVALCSSPELQDMNIGANLNDDIDIMCHPMTSDAVSLESLQKKKQQTLEDCVERNLSYEDGGKRHGDVTQALIFMICKDNLPFSCVEKKGLKKFVHTICPRYKLPSRPTVTQLIEQRYAITKKILINILQELSYISLTSDILTITNSTRSFLVITAHFLCMQNGYPQLESLCLSAQRLFESHTGKYISECFEQVTNDFSISKRQILSITTDGGKNMINAVELFLNSRKKIPCMAHTLNLIVDDALKNNSMFIKLADQVKSIVTYFKQSVNAMDELRADQEKSGRKEGEVLTLIQSVCTRWNSCFDMLKRFLALSAIVAKILAVKSQTSKKVPDMLASSQLTIVHDMISLLGPFKQATEDISGDTYVTASLVIPLTNLLRQELEQLRPATEIGEAIKESLLKGIVS